MAAQSVPWSSPVTIRLDFEHPEDSVSEVLVGLVVCRLGDLVVLLSNVFSFLEDRREIAVSHDSTEVEMRLRPSAGAEKLNQQSGRNPSLRWLTELGREFVLENVDEFFCRSINPSEALANDLGIIRLPRSEVERRPTGVEKYLC